MDGLLENDIINKIDNDDMNVLEWNALAEELQSNIGDHEGGGLYESFMNNAPLDMFDNVKAFDELREYDHDGILAVRKGDKQPDNPYANMNVDELSSTIDGLDKDDIDSWTSMADRVGDPGDDDFFYDTDIHNKVLGAIPVDTFNKLDTDTQEKLRDLDWDGTYWNREAINKIDHSNNKAAAMADSVADHLERFDDDVLTIESDNDNAADGLYGGLVSGVDDFIHKKNPTMPSFGDHDDEAKATERAADLIKNMDQNRVASRFDINGNVEMSARKNFNASNYGEKYSSQLASRLGDNDVAIATIDGAGRLAFLSDTGAPINEGNMGESIRSSVNNIAILGDDFARGISKNSGYHMVAEQGAVSFVRNDIARKNGLIQ